MSNRLDHYVLAVNELDKYRNALSRLGFNLSNVGRHPELGTTNTVIVFEDNYFELFCAPEDANDAVAATRAEIVRDGEGLLSVSLKTEDAASEAARLGAAGAPLPIHVFHRPVNEPGANGEAEFQTVIAPRPAYVHTTFFFCGHKTPHLVWNENSVRHDNGVKTISELLLCADSPAALCAYVEPLWASCRAEPVDGGMRLCGDGPDITILTPAAFDSSCGELGAGEGANHRKCASVFDVQSLADILSFAKEAKVPHHVEGDRVRLLPFPEAPGIHFIFRALS